MSIRDNRIAAQSIGINVVRYKMMAFTISAAIAGMAGVLFSHNISTIQATSQYFGYNVSILILVYVVLGGIGNIRGSVIAACILYLLPELQQVPDADLFDRAHCRHDRELGTGGN